MAKERLKTKKYIENNGKSTLTGAPLPKETRLYDTHRTVPKRKGGTYEDKNYGVANPPEHMKEHGNLRVRSTDSEKLKSMIDDRNQVMKVKNKINNQMLAYERRTDHLNELTLRFLKGEVKRYEKELAGRTRLVEKQVKEMAKDEPLIKATLKVKGIGPITVAYCFVYIDLNKADHASSLWAYVGLDTSANDRYTKGISSGGNKNLRTVLYTMADSQMKSRNRDSAYGYIYDIEKTKKENSTVIVKSRNTQGRLIECMWKDTKPCHRHGHALRVIMKHFLADYWYVGRTLAGLSVSPLYPEAVLKNGHRTIMPEERGWEY